MSELARIVALPSGAALLRLSGELDMAAEVSLREHFAGALRLSPDIVVDLHEVTFLDCAALGVLVWARNRAREAAGSLVLVAPRPPVRRLLELAKVEEVLPVRADLPSAVLATAPGGGAGAGAGRMEPTTGQAAGRSTGCRITQ